MERQAQVSITPSTAAAADRADQNTTCSWSLPGQSVPTQQDKVGHTSWVLHISKFQLEAAASPGCPSLLPALSCPVSRDLQLSLQPEDALFAVNTTSRWISMSPMCVTGSRQSLPQQPRAARREQGCQEGSLGLLPQPLPRAQRLFLTQPWLLLQHNSPLNTQLDTSLRELKPRSKRNTNCCSDLDSSLGLSLLVWKWKSQGLRFKQNTKFYCPSSDLSYLGQS